MGANSRLGTHSNKYSIKDTASIQVTLVPEVFLDFSSRKRSRASREGGDNESRKRRGEREKPLVTLASNLTFMQTIGSGSDPRALIG